MQTSYSHVRPCIDAAYGTHPLSRPRQSTGGELYVRAGVIKTWLQRSRQRRALAELDDRILCDIGVTRKRSSAKQRSRFGLQARREAPYGKKRLGRSSICLAFRQEDDGNAPTSRAGGG